MVWKILKHILKWLGIVVGILILLIVGYFVYNTPFKSKYRQLSDTELQEYVQHLDSTQSDPIEFVAAKFDDHDIVLIGEMHRRLQDVEFVKSLIPYVCRNKNVRVIGWEFGASTLQAQVDSIVTAPVFDERKAIAVMRRSEFYWNFQEYLDIFRVIWQTNRNLPASQEKIRFLQLGSEYIPRLLNSPDPEVRAKEAERFFYDRKMADIMEREVLAKGKKGLWYSGIHHAFTRYRQPRYFFRFVSTRGGNFLFDKYPDRVYLVALHSPMSSRWAFFQDVRFLRSVLVPDEALVYPFQRIFDQVYQKHGKPYAIDAHISPFGMLEDNYSYYSTDYWGPIRVKDYCDGYAVLCSFAEAQPVHPIKDWIRTKEELDEVRAILTLEMAERETTIPDFLRGLEEDVPKTIKYLHRVQEK